MRILLLTLLIISSISNPAHAQQKPAEKVKVRILTFDKLRGIENMQVLYGKKKVAKVKMHKNNFTGPHTVEGRLLQFYKEEVDLTVAADVLPKPESTIVLEPSMGSKVLLIAIPVKGTYRFLPMQDSYDQFRKGQVKMINLSGKVIGAKLNNKSVQVKPRNMHLWKSISSKNEAHDYPAEFYFQDGKKFQMFSSGIWQFRPDIRKYTFIYTDPSSKLLRIKSIADYPPVAKASNP